MGLNSVYGIIFEKLMDIIGNDMDFLSVSDCFKNLCEVKTYNGSFTGIDIPLLDKVIELNLNRMLTLIYTVISSKKEDEDNICDGIKLLYTYFIDSQIEKMKKPLFKVCFLYMRTTQPILPFLEQEVQSFLKRAEYP